MKIRSLRSIAALAALLSLALLSLGACDDRKEAATGAAPQAPPPAVGVTAVSREAVTIPPDYAAEMSPYLAMAGEFRVHYAGFFDPGFGHGTGRGARGVLEVRCHEAPFALEHGQVVGRLVYERMAARPDRLYGAGIASNYQGQGLKLAKQFRQISACGG